MWGFWFFSSSKFADICRNVCLVSIYKSIKNNEDRDMVVKNSVIIGCLIKNGYRTFWLIHFNYWAKKLEYLSPNTFSTCIYVPKHRFSIANLPLLKFREAILHHRLSQYVMISYFTTMNGKITCLTFAMPHLLAWYNMWYITQVTTQGLTNAKLAHNKKRLKQHRHIRKFAFFSFTIALILQTQTAFTE